MARVESTPLQRFLAAVIDFAIVIFIFSILFRFLRINLVYPEMSASDIANLPDSLRVIYETDPNNFITNAYIKEPQLFLQWVYNSDNTYINEVSSIVLGYSFKIICLWALINLVYYVILPLFVKFQTVGRLVLKVKVYPVNKEKLNFSSAFIREFVARLLEILFSMFMFIPYILDLIFLFTRNQTLRDIISNTQLYRFDETATVIINDYNRREEMNHKPDFDSFDKQNTGEIIDAKEEDVEIVVEVDE